MPSAALREGASVGSGMRQRRWKSMSCVCMRARTCARELGAHYGERISSFDSPCRAVSAAHRILLKASKTPT